MGGGEEEAEVACVFYATIKSSTNHILALFVFQLSFFFFLTLSLHSEDWARGSLGKHHLYSIPEGDKERKAASGSIVSGTHLWIGAVSECFRILLITCSSLRSPPFPVIAGRLTLPTPMGACVSAGPSGCERDGVTDSDFFTQDDPYQRQGDERQPGYLMGICPAGKSEGKVAATTQSKKPAGVAQPQCAQAHPHGTRCLQRPEMPTHSWYPIQSESS